MPSIMFTKETARAAALRSAQVRAQKREQLQQQADAVRALREMRAQEEATAREMIRRAGAEPMPGWLADTVSKVRVQIDGVLVKMAECESATELDKLASALHKLVELERVTTMRPAPSPARTKAQKPRGADISALPDPVPIASETGS